MKRLYDLLFSRYRGHLVSLILALILVVNSTVLILAIPYVAREAPVVRHFRNVAPLPLPGGILNSTNTSYEVWPGGEVPQSGMVLLNLSFMGDITVLPPEATLMGGVGRVEGLPVLERMLEGWTIHYLFYPLPGPGDFTLYLRDAGGEWPVGNITVEEDSLDRVLNSPVYTPGEVFEIDIPEGWSAYMNGTQVNSTIPPEFMGNCEREVTLQRGQEVLNFIVYPAGRLERKDAQIERISDVRDTFTRIDYDKNPTPGEVMRVFVNYTGTMLYPEVKVSSIGSLKLAITDGGLETIFSLPLTPTPLNVLLRSGDKKIDLGEIQMGPGLIPLMSFEESPYKGSSYLRIRLLRYTIQDVDAVVVGEERIKLPPVGSERVVHAGGIDGKVMVERNGSIYLTLSGPGRVKVGLITTYKATMTFFLLSPAPPFLVHLPFSLSGGGYVGYFLFLAVVILGSLLYLAYQTSREVREKKMESHRWSASRVALSLFASLFISFSIAWLMALLSKPVSAPRDFDILPNWVLLVELASASVYEELVARLLLIGVPLSLIAFVSNRKGLLKHLLGGFNRWDGPTYFFVLFSSLLFGLAHSPGWGYWKIIPTFVAGLLFGYVFVRVGLHGAILMHFATDYLSTVSMLPEAPLPLSILGVLGMLGALLLSYVYGVHFLGEILDGILKGRGSPLRPLLLLSAPGGLVVLLITTIYIGGGNLAGMIVLLALIVFSLILMLLCLMFTNVGGGIVRALGVLLGLVGAYMTMIFAPLAIPYLIEKIRSLE